MNNTNCHFTGLVNTLIILSIVICFCVLICVGYIFCSQHISFSNAYVEASNAIQASAARLSNKEQIETIKSQIDTLAKLQEIQKNTTTTDLIIFLYSFLSTIFVGIGAYYLKNVKLGVEKASKNLNKQERMFKKSKEVSLECSQCLSETNQAMQAVSNIREDCSKKQQEIIDACIEIERSQSIIKLQSAYQSADLVLAIAFSCEKVDISVPNEKKHLGELMPRFNDAILFLCKTMNVIENIKIENSDKEMLVFILKEIIKSIKRCGERSPLFFSSDYIRLTENKINCCLKVLN